MGTRALIQSEELGGYLRELRVRKGLRQEELAERVADADKVVPFGRREIARIEAGAVARFPVMCKIIEVLGVAKKDRTDLWAIWLSAGGRVERLKEALEVEGFQSALETVVKMVPGASLLRVFLCHASGDKPEVRKLYSWLRTIGTSPWLDEEDLLAGQD